jgi:Domain of unknown function (DUF1841)
MKRYDPLKSPDPEEWLALDEQERIDLVEDYHRRKRIRMPSVRGHAAFHVIVENQIAMGEELPVKRKLQQLMDEGLDRHDAIHAIGSVLSRQFYHILKRGQSSDPPKAYYAALEDLTAEIWLRSGEE